MRDSVAGAEARRIGSVCGACAAPDPRERLRAPEALWCVLGCGTRRRFGGVLVAPRLESGSGEI